MKPEPIVYAQYGPVPQGTVFLYSGVLTQEDAITPVPGNSVTALILTLTDLQTAAIINGRDKQNVLNANQCTFDATGNTGAFQWRSVIADSPFIQVDPPVAEGEIEVHQAIIQWSWLNTQGQVVSGARKIFILVERYLGADVTGEGSGSSLYTGAIYDTDGSTPLEGIQVWVTTDIGGTARVAGPQQTDCHGEYSFNLDPGAYWLWMSSGSYNFSQNPVPITVV